MKSNCSSCQPWSFSNFSILSACMMREIVNIKTCRKPLVDQRTPWQTTHMGIPSPSSHSPGPNGIVTGPAELVNPCAPPELESMPRFRSLHSVRFSSMTIFVSSSSDISTCRRRRTHSRSRRIHVHGSDQSSKITTSVSGID